MAKPIGDGSFWGQRRSGTDKDSGIIYEWQGDGWYPVTEGMAPDLVTPPAVTQAPTGTRAAERWAESLTGETDRGVETSAPPSPTSGDVMLDRLLGSVRNIGRLHSILSGGAVGGAGAGTDYLSDNDLAAIREAIAKRGGLESALRAYGGFDVDAYKEVFGPDSIWTPGQFEGGELGARFDKLPDWFDRGAEGGAPAGIEQESLEERVEREAAEQAAAEAAAAAAVASAREPLAMEDISPFSAYLSSLGELYGPAYTDPGSYGYERAAFGRAPWGYGAYESPYLMGQIRTGLENVGIPDVSGLNVGDIFKGLQEGENYIKELAPGFQDYLSRMATQANPLRATREQSAYELGQLAGGNIADPLRSIYGGYSTPSIPAGQPGYSGEGGPIPFSGAAGFMSPPGTNRAAIDALENLAQSALANRLGGFAYNWLSPMLQSPTNLASEYYAGTGGRGGLFEYGDGREAANLPAYLSQRWGLRP